MCYNIMHASDVMLPHVRQVMYDSLPGLAFFALVAALVGAYMFYAGNKVGLDSPEFCLVHAWLCEEPVDACRLMRVK